MIDIEAILNQLDPEVINIQVLMKHDVARERYQPVSLLCADGREFQEAVTRYVRHHQQAVGEGTPSEDAARDTATGILDRAFSDDPFQEGYTVAEQLAVDGRLHEVLNELHAGCGAGRREPTYGGLPAARTIPLSRSDHLELSRAFYERFRTVFERAGIVLDEQSFMGNTRALFEYLLPAGAGQRLQPWAAGVGAAVKGSASRTTSEITAVMRVLDPAWISRACRGCPSPGARELPRRTDHRPERPGLRERGHGIFAGVMSSITEGQELSADAALDLAKGLLDEGYSPGTLGSGYDAALASALGLSHGGLPDVINALARGCSRRALRNHVGSVFREHVDLLSGAARLAFGAALKTRYGQAFERFGIVLEDFLVAQDPLGSLWRVRSELEQLLARLEGL